MMSLGTRIAIGALSLAAASEACLGCSYEPPPSEKAAGSAALAERTSEARLAWGSGEGRVGLRSAVAESAAEGPSAVAVTARGAVLVLDRLNERVLEVSAGGAVKVAAAVPRDAQQIAAGPDGTLAAWSPLRATVWLTAPSGKSAGEVAVPRALRDLQSMSLHASHRVRVASALQESFELGSPRAPLDLAATLRTGREGAAFLPDGRGVAARRTEGGGEILVYARLASRDEGKRPIEKAHRIDGPVASVRVIGAAAGVVCARVERVTASPEIHVEREVRCVDPDSGAVLLQTDLPARGLYAPDRDLALGGSPPVLALIHADEEGLLVKRWTLATAVTMGETPKPPAQPASAGEEVAR